MLSHEKVALVTGAASGSGEAVVRELAHRGARAVILVDRSDRASALAASINESASRPLADAWVGDATDDAFRARVFEETAARHGIVHICVPAAGCDAAALELSSAPQPNAIAIRAIARSGSRCGARRGRTLVAPRDTAAA